MLKVLTFNAAILDVRILGHSFFKPVDHIQQRLQQLAITLEQSCADIIFLQEVFHRDNQQKLCKQLSGTHPYVSELAPAGWKFRLGTELLIFSRYPLQNGSLIRFQHAPAEELRHTSKGFFHVEVEIAGIGKINLINLHMSAGGKHQHPQSTTMEAIRQKQIQQVLDYSSSFDKVIMAGDLNAGPETSHDNYRQLLSAGYHDLFTEAGGTGISWDPDNPLVKHGGESHLPPQRIDHVFGNTGFFKSMRKIDANIVMHEHCVKSKGGHIPLSDHYGLCIDIEW